jgi:aerobic-type carbon monoxide dehydrogenase small subunit (CoxS/CutS family)
MAEQKDSETREKKNTPSQISRREFLKDAGLIVGGATVGSMGILSACNNAATKTVTNNATVTKTLTTTVTAPGGTAVTTVTVTATPPDSAQDTINLTINNQKYLDITVKPSMTLKDLLHDQLGFIEVKEMCTGLGACGSCSVIMDGRPILSCLTLAATCDGAVIETSLGVTQEKHPLVEAYIKNHCMQCGYCTPGFLVTSKALLDKNPSPTEQDIITALAGNLCRCGTYPQHITAVLEAATTLKGGTK